MTEEKYRSCKLILLAVFVAGFLALGAVMAENGRYVQYDAQKDWVVFGSGEGRSSGITQVLDTRTGVVRAGDKK